MNVENGVLKELQEKPIKYFDVSMGVYMMSKQAVDLIPDKKPFGFDDLMVKMLKNGLEVRVSNYDGYWLDIGRPDDYHEAIDIFKDNSKTFLR